MPIAVNCDINYDRKSLEHPHGSSRLQLRKKTHFSTENKISEAAKVSE